MLALAVVLLVAGCSSENGGDLAAFCQLAVAGVGSSAAEGPDDLAQLDALKAAAPPDIRDAATTVANASREIDEIDDLRELFRRAFALEEAVATARQDILTYTQNHCQ